MDVLQDLDTALKAAAHLLQLAWHIHIKSAFWLFLGICGQLSTVYKLGMIDQLISFVPIQSG